MSAYATYIEGDTYFASRLYSDVWVLATSQDKTKALAGATRIIDRLNFAGQKHAAYLAFIQIIGTRPNPNYDTAVLTQVQRQAIRDAASTQELEFPRGSDMDIPSDIKIASYEIAFALLDGVDADIEYEDQQVVSQGYAGVRTTYDRDSVQEHTNSGVPSATAWRYLKPYLRQDNSIKIHRV